MDAHVIIATKGRSPDVRRLLDFISAQTLLPATVTIVGVSEIDVQGVLEHPHAPRLELQILLSEVAGLCIQRNIGVGAVLSRAREGSRSSHFFVAFFDDDFRPAPDWLERCHGVFDRQPDVAALTGYVLADGVHGGPVTDADCLAYLSSQKPPKAHWASGEEQRHLESMYGCNMAFRDVVVENCRFDENLPLYGWQEDQDYTSQAASFGRTVFEPSCRGVHLGSSAARVSGLKFGYSQIANPFYLWRKGTMSARKGATFVARHLLANGARTLRRHPRVDYPGRLRGNLLAFADIACGRCHPTRVLAIS